MDYLRIYNNLIERAVNRILAGYVERHHIVPRCMGGTDDASNIAVLTPEEHFAAHQLLIKIHPNNSKLLWAVRMMTAARPKQIRNNKEYSWIKRRIAAYMSLTRKGIKTGKQKARHLVDPYIKAITLNNHLEILILHAYYNPYRSATDVIISSNLFVSISCTKIGDKL